MDESSVVALFVTCIVDQIMPEIGVATVKVLRRTGHTVAFPAEQTCCGQPFFNSGFRKQARDLARHTIEILEPYERVVLPSGSCTTMIRQEYPHLFEDDPAWHERALALAEKTHELTEFLAGKVPTADLGGTVTYHDSCHMCRLLGLRDEPRQALDSAGVVVNEMADNNLCCGFGGLFSLRMSEVSTAMTTEKIAQAEATGAGAIITADPGCLMQMRSLEGRRIHVEHIAVLLERATR